MKLFSLRRTTFAESRSKTKIYIDVAGERRNVLKFSPSKAREKFSKKNLLFFQEEQKELLQYFLREGAEKLNVAQLWEDALTNSVNYHNGGVAFNARLGPKLCFSML